MPTVRQTDLMDPARAQALFAALGQETVVQSGDRLPPFFHQIYFWNAMVPSALGRDGHPAVGAGLIPDLGLPRRMWAGGRLSFHTPLRAGVPAVCEARVKSVQEKNGRTGPLGLVTLSLTYLQDSICCVEEERDLIYRADADPAAPRPAPPIAPSDCTYTDALNFDTTVLFRYSALTFNGHRIHYDLEYAKAVEGYDGLVVHGPLLAQHAMLFAERNIGPLRGFEFRATAPLMHTETAWVRLKGHDVWVVGPDNRLCLTGRVQI